MVASTSMLIAERLELTTMHFVKRQISALLLGIMAAIICNLIPLKLWKKLSFSGLFISFILLIAVLLPGISREVNGSQRWLILGPLGFQPSEFVKLAMLLYFSGYLVRRSNSIAKNILAFIKPLIILSLVSILLILEPDFGSVVVLFAMTMGILFIAKVPLRNFGYLFLSGIGLLLAVAVSSPYRLKRVTSFLDPWADQFNSGYQLTQSLIAFGQGNVTGLGLGDSIQKLLYLPEAHTDFIFAVVAEELGLIGATITMSLYYALVIRLFYLSNHFRKSSMLFASYFTAGLGLWIGTQTLINLGVTMGILPTKGLTLPLLSYGGTSLFVMLIALGIVFRMNFECKTTRRF